MASPILEIPLIAAPQVFGITLNQVDYQFTVLWRVAPEAGWLLDIADSLGNPLVSGIPLVTGADLMAQYKATLNLGGGLYVQSDFNPDTVPTFQNLGQTAHLYYMAY